MDLDSPPMVNGYFRIILDFSLLFLIFRPKELKDLLFYPNDEGSSVDMYKISTVMD